MGEKYINKNGDISELPPYKCRICGLGNIEHDYEICKYCGWEADDIQNDNKDYMGGANKMSFNQYKKFWEENKEEILKAKNTCFKAIDLAKEYYKKHFENNKNN